MLKLRNAPRPSSTTVAGQRGGSTLDGLHVASARKRFLRRQRARRWLVWRRILAVLAVVGVITGLVWLFLFSSVLAVQGAEVRGVEVLSAAEVEEAAAVPLGVPLATVNLDAIEARIEELPAVESAEASRSWPDRVSLQVSERQAVAVVVWEGQWRGLDESGVLFRTYPEEPAGLPQVTMSAATPAEALAEAAAVVQALPADLLGRMEQLEVTSIDGISLKLTGGATVVWGSADESADKVAVLEVLLKDKAQVYDVTAPGRPTIRQ